MFSRIPPGGPYMQSSYNFWLVAISFAVATLASYTALALTGRIVLLGSARCRS